MVSMTAESDRRYHILHLTPYENLIFEQKILLNCAPFTTGASLICALCINQLNLLT